MYHILVRFVGRYAPIVTFPVAVILGGIGYLLESSLRPVGPPPSNGESTIKEREDRLLNNENVTLNLEPSRKNIFEKNDPNLLKR
jgi:hypothetical protein